MIISHSKRFIFVKTRKTAGSSLQKAFASTCAPGDILFSAPSLLPPWAPIPKISPMRKFHAGKSYIREHFPYEWENYTTITAERNPFDKVVSLYLWQMRSETRPPTFEEWFTSRPDQLFSDFDLYGDREGNILVDHVILFETLQAGYLKCCQKLDLDVVPLSTEKRSERTEDEVGSSYFTKDMNQRMRRIFVRESEAFGYDLFVPTPQGKTL